MIGTLIEPELHDMIRQGNWAELREAVSELDASDVAELLCDLPQEDMATVFRVIPQKLAAEAFAYLPADQEEMLLQGFSNEQVRQVIGHMPPDDQARMLEELPAGVVRRLMETVPAEQLKSARDLLGYPPHSAGRYVTPRYVPGRSDAGGLVAGHEAGNRQRSCPGHMAGFHRLSPRGRLAEPAPVRLRLALRPGGTDRLDEPDRRGDVRDIGREHAAICHAATGI